MFSLLLMNKFHSIGNNDKNIMKRGRKNMCDDLNLLLSNLNVFYRKLQNFHWNVTGKDFYTVHEKLEEYYNDINEQIDEVAEHIISKECNVMATMKEYLETAQIKEAESKKIYSEEIWKEVLEGFEILIENCKKIKEEADSEKAYTTSSLMDDYLKDYKKKCWMISQVVGK